MFDDTFIKIECPAPFTRIGDLTGCYRVVSKEVSWDEAEAACQALDPQAHLVSFESKQVSVQWVLNADSSRLTSRTFCG